MQGTTDQAVWRGSRCLPMTMDSPLPTVCSTAARREPLLPQRRNPSGPSSHRPQRFTSKQPYTCIYPQSLVLSLSISSIFLCPCSLLFCPHFVFLPPSPFVRVGNLLGEADGFPQEDKPPDKKYVEYGDYCYLQHVHSSRHMTVRTNCPSEGAPNGFMVGFTEGAHPSCFQILPKYTIRKMGERIRLKDPVFRAGL